MRRNLSRVARCVLRSAFYNPVSYVKFAAFDALARTGFDDACELQLQR
ncbi:MAG: hypothetical protein M3N23_00880 [Pseudomonadota bacterium]|nr:hypothetical protein [Pseudomonadota bacterium]